MPTTKAHTVKRITTLEAQLAHMTAVCLQHIRACLPYRTLVLEPGADVAFDGHTLAVTFADGATVPYTPFDGCVPLCSDEYDVHYFKSVHPLVVWRDIIWGVDVSAMQDDDDHEAYAQDEPEKDDAHV